RGTLAATHPMSVSKLLTAAGFDERSTSTVAIVEKACRKRLSADLRALFSQASGEYLGGHSFMRVFEADEFVDVCGQKGLYKDLPGFLYFASDDGDWFYALAPDGAIYKVDRGAASRSHLQLCAADLATFVRRTLEGENWLGSAPREDPIGEV